MINYMKDYDKASMTFNRHIRPLIYKMFEIDRDNIDSVVNDFGDVECLIADRYTGEEIKVLVRINYGLCWYHFAVRPRRLLGSKYNAKFDDTDIEDAKHFMQCYVSERSDNAKAAIAPVESLRKVLLEDDAELDIKVSEGSELYKVVPWYNSRLSPEGVQIATIDLPNNQINAELYTAK